MVAALIHTAAACRVRGSSRVAASPTWRSGSEWRPPSAAAGRARRAASLPGRLGRVRARRGLKLQERCRRTRARGASRRLSSARWPCAAEALEGCAKARPLWSAGMTDRQYGAASSACAALGWALAMCAVAPCCPRATISVTLTATAACATRRHAPRTTTYHPRRLLKTTKRTCQPLRRS